MSINGNIELFENFIACNILTKNIFEQFCWGWWKLQENHKVKKSLILALLKLCHNFFNWKKPWRKNWL